jgi:hypothetical protein
MKFYKQMVDILRQPLGRKAEQKKQFNGLVQNRVTKKP